MLTNSIAMIIQFSRNQHLNIYYQLISHSAMLQMMSLLNLAEQHEYVFVPHVFISIGDICTQITSKLINIDIGKVSSPDNISKIYQ